MTTIFKKLQSLNFTENQIHIYLALYKLKTAKAGEIIKKTKIHRNIVYSVLEELINKNLVNKSLQKGMWIYETLPTTNLLKEIENKIDLTKSVIQDLSTMVNQNKQTVNVYQGIDAIRKYELENYKNLKENSVIYFLGISPMWYEIVGEEIFKELLLLTKEKKIKQKAIAKEISSKDKLFAKKTKGLIEIKVSNILINNINAIEIQDSHISIRSYVEPYFIIKIENQELRDNYFAYFNLIWNRI